jgi:hypothetical protein
MGDSLHDLLDVTIVYPQGAPSMWDLCCGSVRRIVVRIDRRPIESWLSGGDYQNDEQFRLRFQQWLSEIWSRKDQQICEVLADARTTAQTPGHLQ